MTRFELLLRGYAEDRLTAEELTEFFNLADQYEPLMKEQILADLKALSFTGETSPEQRALMYERVKKQIGINETGLTDAEQHHQVAVVRGMSVWKRWVAAASIILMIGLGSYFLFFNHTRQTEIVQTQEQRFKNDINPGKYKARLTLADGKTIVLDSVTAGELTKQGTTAVISKDGQLVYEGPAIRQADGDKEVLYNTLSTARGETYATVLADGSKVWLNAASSIRFPVAFVGNERKVEITGEAYFEIATSVSPQGGSKRPFIVSRGDVSVTVLGTHFNVNAYDDESDMKVTLLEGSVKTSIVNGESSILKPGQQAVIMKSGPGNYREKIENAVDIDQVMAWKNGRFYFENSSVESIMRQAERWYDIDVEFKDKIPHLFVAKIPRDVPMSELLKLLELTDRVHFEIDGKKVKVMK